MKLRPAVFTQASRRARRRGAPFSVALCIALAASMSPLGLLPCAAAKTASRHTACASADDIARMLDAGAYAPGEAIVVVRETGDAGPELDGADELMQADEDAYEQATGRDDAPSAGVSVEHVVRDSADTAALMAELAADPRVLSVEPNYVHELDDSDTATAQASSAQAENPYVSYTYNRDFDMSPWQWMSTGKTTMTMPDTQASESAAVHAPDWNDANAAIDETSDETECVVAVLDTGVDYTHPDLQDKVYRFSKKLQGELGCGAFGAHFGNGGIIGTDPSDDHGHGTHCAGNVVAAWDNAGTGGVTNGVKVMALKVSDASYVYPDAALLAAYDFVGRAADAGVPVRVTSNSYGGSTRTTAQNIALAQLGEHGVISVFAAGNERQNVDDGGESNDFPNNPYTVVVDATRPDGAPSAFTVYGLKTDVHAPGASIMSTVPWFARQYFAPADEDAALYKSAASSTKAWTGDSGGIVVKRASAGSEPGNPNNAFVETPDETSVNLEQGSADVSFDGDGKSAQVTLGKVQGRAYDDEGKEVTVDSSKFVYLDFALPVQAAPYASLCAYVTGFDGSWSYVQKEGSDGKPTIDSHLMVKVKDENGRQRWLQDYDGRCYNEGAWQHVSFDFDKSLKQAKDNEEQDADKSYTYALDASNCLQMRLRLQGVAGIAFKEGTKIYLDCFGVGKADTKAALPYSIWDGTSMATPIAAGVAATISQSMQATLSSKEPAAAAARLCELVKACVTQDERYEKRCAQRGTLDLSLLGEDGSLDLDKAAPVIDATKSPGDKVVIEGFAFGASAGTLRIDGTTVATSAWTMEPDGTSRIEFSWPDGLENGVKTVTVENAVSGKAADTYLLLVKPESSKRFYEEDLPMDSFPIQNGEDARQICGLDGALYVLLENFHSAYTRVVSYNLASKRWDVCTEAPFEFTRASMAAHAGKLLVAGAHAQTETDKTVTTCRMLSYDPAAKTWTELDAENFPEAGALVDCAGELLVAGTIPAIPAQEDSADEIVPTRIARWELNDADTENPYEIGADDIVCTLAGSYIPERKDGFDSISYPSLVASQGSCIYIADRNRLDADGALGVGLEKIVRTSAGTYESTDYADKLREPSDDDGASSSQDGRIWLERKTFALAAADTGPALVGADAYEGTEHVDADTFVMKDDGAGLEDFGKRFSISTLENTAACAYAGKLYAIACPIDEAIGYKLRATQLSTSDPDHKSAAANPLKVKGRTVKFKAKTLKKKARKVAAAKAFKITKNVSKAKISYKKSSGASKLKVAGNGTITAKKGLKKGTYKLRVTATQKATESWQKKTVKKITVTVRVV